MVLGKTFICQADFTEEKKRNLKYEIKSGDTIQKILKKNKVQNNEIQSIIDHYKKFANPNNLMVGNKIDITVKKNAVNNENNILNFSIPISKSTTIEIKKNSLNQIESQNKPSIELNSF